MDLDKLGGDTVAISTELDDGAALFLVAALEDAGIPAGIHRVTRMVYLPSATMFSLEVRVPADREREARGVAERILAESPQGDATGWDHAEGTPESAPAREPSEPLPEPNERRRPKVWMSIPVSLAVPVPGAGAFYARFYGLGFLMLGIAGTGFLASFLGRGTIPLMLYVVVRVVDLVLAPVLAALANRREGGRASIKRAAAISLLLALFAVAVLLAALRPDPDAEFRYRGEDAPFRSR